MMSTHFPKLLNDAKRSYLSLVATEKLPKKLNSQLAKNGMHA